MRRSRATLATIEAAAMVALVASPWTTSPCSGAPAPSARSPSTRRSSARSPTARSARSRQATLAGSIPIRSIWRAEMDTSETASAWLKMARARRSRFGTAKPLRVVQLVEQTPTCAEAEPLKIEEHPRGHDRAGPGGAPHLVDARDQANAASAIVVMEGRVDHGCAYSSPPGIRRSSAARRTQTRSRASMTSRTLSADTIRWSTIGSRRLSAGRLTSASGRRSVAMRDEP